MECNLRRNSVWSQLILVLFACYWKFVTGDPELVNDKVVKEINGAINSFVFDKVRALEGKINDSSLTCTAKITSEYKHCETCMKRCGIHEPLKNLTVIISSTTIHFPSIPSPTLLPYLFDKITPPLIKGTVEILGNMGRFADKAVKDLFKGVSDTAKRLGKILKTRIQLPRIAFRAPRIRLPRITVHVPRIRLPRIAYRAPRVRLPRFRAPRFSRGWGKKRDVQKAAREMGCSCSMCEPFQEDDSETEKIKRVCGSSYSSEIKKLQIELNDSYNIYKFTNNYNNNQFVTKIVQELWSLKNINNKYYLINSIMTLSMPNGSEFSVKMTKGMPFGITPSNTTEITEIANLEGPKIFTLLRKNS